MRPGQDRFEVGTSVKELLFPDASGHLLGAMVGDPVAEVSARVGEPTNGTYLFEVEDPMESGRRLEVRLGQQQGRVHFIDAHFFSAHKIDVDAAYDAVRKHLKSKHGRPGRETGGVLKFVWTLKGAELPSRTVVCRFKDASGLPVLHVTTKLEQEGALPGIGRGPGLAAKKGS